MKNYDENEIRKAIAQLKPDGSLFEVRIVTGTKKTLSGYFKTADKLISALNTVDLRDANVYITLNSILEALYSRQQSDKFLLNKQSTKDNDVIGYSWLFIDFDPVRLSGISSSDEELHKAYELANKVYGYLKKNGFTEPIKAVSGNGAHLLYKIGLSNSTDNQALIKKCLSTLSFMFDTDDVKVDTSNFNPSRVCKLYGTMAQKGANTSERPHRMSRILGDVIELQQTPKSYLERLASFSPKTDNVEPAKYNNFQPSDFDIEDWMQSHSIEYAVKEWNGCTKYVLAHCPFDENHTAPDSCIIKQGSGAIGFKCLHNSCQDKTWRDVRLLFEPDAYEKKQINDELSTGWQKHKANSEQKINYEPPELAGKPKFSTVKMILAEPEKKREFIATGIKEIDRAIRGLEKGTISLLTGLRASAKSTLINQLILEARAQGYTSICYSGELSGHKFVNWLNLNAAGPSNVTESKQYPGYYYVNPECVESIADWLGDKVWIYNNDYGNNFKNITEYLETQIAETKADLVILDNLMALNIKDLNSEKYDAQTAFVNVLATMAQKTNTHIMFVAHPRKAQGFLRLDDVSGSGDLSNRVDYAFIIHRNNEDFKRLSSQMFKWKDTHPAYSGTNSIEICKDRDGGNQDLFIPLWFENSTKRLKNYTQECKVYDWAQTPSDGFTSALDDELPWS